MLPLGMFWLKDVIEGTGEERYVGIDNRGGDAWTEDFPTKGKCLGWLKK